MRFKSDLSLVAAICVAAAALPLWAHHSHGNYEDTFMDIEGVVKEVHLVVPHSWVYVEIKDAKGGEPQVWVLEATGRTQLQKIGVTVDTVKPGDTITGIGYQFGDGQKIIRLERAVLGNGKEMRVYAQ